jgi:hypothetical protein
MGGFETRPYGGRPEPGKVQGSFALYEVQGEMEKQNKRLFLLCPACFCYGEKKNEEGKG